LLNLQLVDLEVIVGSYNAVSEQTVQTIRIMCGDSCYIVTWCCIFWYRNPVAGGSYDWQILHVLEVSLEDGTLIAGYANSNKNACGIC